MPPQKAKREDNSISFRLEDDALEALLGRAAYLNVSKNILARSYVLQILSEENDRNQIVEEITALKHTVENLVADQVAGIETTLAWAGKLTEEEAKKYVDQNYRPV